MSKFFYTAKWKMCFIILAIAAVIAVSCTKQSEDVLKAQTGTVSCDTVGVQYSTSVLPILQANCYRCHAGGIVNGGVTLDGYANTVIQAKNGSLIGAITHAPGFTPMPDDGGKLSDCDIAKIQAWINAGTPDN